MEVRKFAQLLDKPSWGGIPMIWQVSLVHDIILGTEYHRYHDPDSAASTVAHRLGLVYY